MSIVLVGSLALCQWAGWPAAAGSASSKWLAHALLNMLQLVLRFNITRLPKPPTRKQTMLFLPGHNQCGLELSHKDPRQNSQRTDDTKAMQCCTHQLLTDINRLRTSIHVGGDRRAHALTGGGGDGGGDGPRTDTDIVDRHVQDSTSFTKATSH